MTWRLSPLFWQFASLLVLAPTLLASCTPPQSSAPTTEWVLVNQTPDTLRVAVRYPLDSTAVTLAELSEARHQLKVDSVNSIRLIGYYRPHFLQHLTRHHGQWYLVQHTTDTPAYYADADSRSSEQAPLINTTRGEFIYRVPPFSTQHVLETETTPVQAQAESPILSLHLHQRGLHVAVLPRLPLLEVFQPQATGQEHAYSPRYFCRLTVGPGLTIQ
jgi:hypothetical protein